VYRKVRQFKRTKQRGSVRPKQGTYYDVAGTKRKDPKTHNGHNAKSNQQRLSWMLLNKVDCAGRDGGDRVHDGARSGLYTFPRRRPTAEQLRDAHMAFAEILDARQAIPRAAHHWKAAADLGKLIALGLDWSATDERRKRRVADAKST